MKDTIPTPEQVCAYLDTDGGRCPFCESAHISESGPTEDAGSVLVVGMRCADCGTHWGATYHLDAVWPVCADEAIYPPDAQAERIAALETALRDLFEHCAMTHNRWGDGCNRTEATAAIARARALIA